MTSPLACSATTTKGTGGSSAMASSRQARTTKHTSRWPIAPSGRSLSLRGHDMALDDRFSQDFREPDGERPLGTRNEIITGLVSDWATDFSHLEPEWSADPYPIQDDLRQRCPIAHTDRFGGAWLPTRYEDVAAIAYDTGRFSSRSIILSNFRPPREGAPPPPPRPAVPPRCTQAAAAPLHQERGRTAGAGHQGVLPLTHRRFRGAGGGRRGPRLRPAHPDAGHRRHARLPGGGWTAIP